MHIEARSFTGRGRTGSTSGTRTWPSLTRDLPTTVRALQSTVGNRAVAALVTGSLARQATAGAGAKTAGATGVRFNDYADLCNDVQELAAAALNQKGQGLKTYRLGRDLSVAHRNLLEDVRKVLIDGDPSSPAEARQSAAADWRRVEAKLKVSLEDARKIGVRGAVLAAVSEDLALIGERYLHVRPKGPTELESGEDYADALTAVQDLLNVFESMNEGSLGLLREQVKGRPDAGIGMATQEINARQRTRLQSVKLGEHLLARHRAVLEKLRQSMVLARSETPGSAYKALTLWRSIRSELGRVMTRAPTFVEGNVGEIARALDNYGVLLAKHYELVHVETIATALKAQPKPGEAEAEQMLAKVGGTQAVAALHENRMFDQFRYVLEIIEHGLTRVPGRPGEWLLTSGPVQVRIRDDEAANIRATAAQQLKDYMRYLVHKMVDAAENYDSIKRGNSSFKLHLLGGWGGADDPGSQDHFKMSVIRVRDTIVFPMIDRGEYLQAFGNIMNQKAIVERQAKEVADYDTDLDVGYNRLGRAMQVLEVALTALVPVAGEAALASGAGLIAVGGTAAAAGTGGAVLVEGTREVVSGEGLQAGKLVSTGRHALAISGGAVAAPVTKALGGVLGAAEPGVTGLIAETAATGTVGGTQSLIGGGSFGEGFLGSSLTHLGMRGLGGAGVTGPVGTTLGSAGAGAFGSWASGGDWLTGAVGGVDFVGGALPTAAGHLTRPAGGGAGHEAVPVHVGPEGDAAYHGPAPSSGTPVHVGPEGDATYHGPVPSDGIPTPHPGSETTPPPGTHAAEVPLANGAKLKRGPKGRRTLCINPCADLDHLTLSDEVIDAAVAQLPREQVVDMVKTLAAFKGKDDIPIVESMVTSLSRGGSEARSAVDLLDRITGLRDISGYEFSLSDLAAAHARGDAILAHGPVQDAEFLEDITWGEQPVGPWGLKEGQLWFANRRSLLEHGLPPKLQSLDFVILENDTGVGYRLILGHNHSGLSGGKAFVFAAGEFRFNVSGELVAITRKSGHYQPAENNLQRAQEFLRSRNMLSPRGVELLESVR